MNDMNNQLFRCLNESTSSDIENNFSELVKEAAKENNCEVLSIDEKELCFELKKRKRYNRNTYTFLFDVAFEDETLFVTVIFSQDYYGSRSILTEPLDEYDYEDEIEGVSTTEEFKKAIDHIITDAEGRFFPEDEYGYHGEDY